MRGAVLKCDSVVQSKILQKGAELLFNKTASHHEEETDWSIALVASVIVSLRPSTTSAQQAVTFGCAHACCPISEAFPYHRDSCPSCGVNAKQVGGCIYKPGLASFLSRSLFIIRLELCNGFVVLGRSQVTNIVHFVLTLG